MHINCYCEYNIEIIYKNFHIIVLQTNKLQIFLSRMHIITRRIYDKNLSLQKTTNFSNIPAVIDMINTPCNFYISQYTFLFNKMVGNEIALRLLISSKF